MIVYVSIGNSDDKLTQLEWALFYQRVTEALNLTEKHGVWLSAPDSRFQNACWCFEDGGAEYADILKRRLREIATEFRQDSITWAVAETEFLLGASPAPQEGPQ